MKILVLYLQCLQVKTINYPPKIISLNKIPIIKICQGVYTYFKPFKNLKR